MHIDAFEYGSITIDGRTYRTDLLIWPGHIKHDWWRGEGHRLQLADVAEVLTSNPQVLVVGTGVHNRMQVDPELILYLKEQGIELLARPTPEACQSINGLSDKRRLAAALHLTC